MSIELTLLSVRIPLFLSNDSLSWTKLSCYRKWMFFIFLFFYSSLFFLYVVFFWCKLEINPLFLWKCFFFFFPWKRLKWCLCAGRHHCLKIVCDFVCQKLITSPRNSSKCGLTAEMNSKRTQLLCWDDLQEKEISEEKSFQRYERTPAMKTWSRSFILV